MIHYVQGVVRFLHESAITVDVGSIGVWIWVPQPALFTLDEKVTVLCHLHWHQENGPTLYGFMQEADKALFILLISCAGVGPKLALAALSLLGTQECVHAIAAQQATILAKVPGIGLKKAEQIIVQLKDKVAKLIASDKTLEKESLGVVSEVTQALLSLRYTPAEVSSAMRHLNGLPQKSPVAFELLMRQALSFLAKKGINFSPMTYVFSGE